MTEYRRLKGRNIWHWCKNCHHFPGRFFDFKYIEYTKTSPTTGKLCKKCEEKEKRNNCIKYQVLKNQTVQILLRHSFLHNKTPFCSQNNQHLLLLHPYQNNSKKQQTFIQHRLQDSFPIIICNIRIEVVHCPACLTHHRLPIWVSKVYQKPSFIMSSNKRYYEERKNKGITTR